MLFSSLAFLFIFLPLVLILYHLNRSSLYRNIILLLASLFFYAWGEPVFIFLLAVMIILNWRGAIWIENSHDQPGKQGAHLTTLFIVINLLPLLIFKLLTTSSLGLSASLHLDEAFPNLSFPLGISFFTFSAISYLVDVSRGETEAERNLLYVCNYMVLFPKMLQGPITRFKTIRPALDDLQTNPEDTAAGLRRFIIGLAKKVLVADNIAVVADKVFALSSAELPAGLAWYGLIAYAVQIYMDFSGYTDMALGLGKMFGFSLPENFNFPYLSRSVADFWRRWHISLMNFFRNYIFLPLEIARRKEKHFRQQSNLLVVFLATGLWHGITLNFILWGLYFGLIIVLESSFLSRWLKKIPIVLQNLYALALILVGWIFFRIEDLGSWGPFFKSLLGLNRPSPYYSLRTLNILMYFPLLLVGILGSTPLLGNLYKRSREARWSSVVVDAGLIGLFVLCAAVAVSGSYQAFLYSEF